MLTEQHRRDLEKTIKQQRKELRRLQAVEQAHWSMLWRFKDERDAATAEITQLRAEIARARDVGGLYQILFRDFCDRGEIISALERELAAERELADRLAECAAIVQCDVEDVTQDQVWEEISIDKWNNLTYAIQDVRTRRNK